MSRVFALAAVVFFVTPVAADDKDWTGKTVKLKESVKLGSKLGGGLVRDGAALDKGKTFVVKSDDGSYLELVGETGYVFKSEAEVVAGREMPKKGDPPAKVDEKNLWAEGTKVLPKIDSDKIQFGDRDADGKQVYFKIAGLDVIVLRDNGDGWVRVRDRSREGWVSKDDFVTAADAPIYFDKAVKADPKNSWVLFMRAAGWAAKGEYDNAIKDYTDYIRLNPDSSAAYNNRGGVWWTKKDYDKAIADYTEAIRLDPKDASVYTRRGVAWGTKRDYDKAIADYTEAIRLDPKHVTAYFIRGIAWVIKGEYDKAIADYTEAIRLDPKYVFAYSNRGDAWGNKREYDKAIADYTEAIRLDPKYVYAYSRRGVAWQAKGEYDKAIADSTEAIRLDPRYVFSYSNRGDAWGNKKEYDKAIADYTEAIRLDPKYVDSYISRGNTWAKTKKFKKSLADYDKASELDPNNATALNLVAWRCATCPDETIRDGKKAVEAARKAVKLSDTWNHRDTLAAAYAEAADFELAVTEQRKALEDKALDKDDRKKMEARLELYRAKKPYRDDE